MDPAQSLKEATARPEEHPSSTSLLIAGEALPQSGRAWREFAAWLCLWRPVERIARAAAGLLFRYRPRVEVRVEAGAATVTRYTRVWGRERLTGVQIVSMSSLIAARLDQGQNARRAAIGIAAFASGTFLGTWLLVRGAEAGSPSVAAFGTLVICLGAALDFVREQQASAQQVSPFRLSLEWERGPSLALQVSETEGRAFLSSVSQKLA